MLPIITIKDVEDCLFEIMKDLAGWRKEMIHYIKDENPELNTLIIELSEKGGLDPKAVAAGAYAAYRLLENAQPNDSEGENPEDDFSEIE